MSDVPEETMTSETAMESDITEQQQAAMQQEEKVLTEQIENLQKEKWVSRKKEIPVVFCVSFLLPFGFPYSLVTSCVKHYVRWSKGCRVVRDLLPILWVSVEILTSGKEIHEWSMNLDAEKWE